MAEVTGAAASSERLDRTAAPMKADKPPGTPSLSTVGQCTLPKRQWLIPETRVVPSSEVCTTAEAVAGPRPASNRMVVEVTPKPIPMPPSTSCAAAPASAMRMRLRMGHLRIAVRHNSGERLPQGREHAPRLAAAIP